MTYQFRMPRHTPVLTYAALRVYMAGKQTATIGATVTLTDYTDTKLGTFIAFSLYATPLARIAPEHVVFTEHDDRHQATREWLSKIVVDNGLGSSVWRPRAGYVPGVGSPLCIDGDPAKPVEGHGYIRAARPLITSIEEGTKA